MGTCGACGAANRDEARFCAACGGSLAAPCVACGSLPAQPDARFCDRCGAPLGTAAASPPVPQARKVVTIAFADLVGSTALHERLDPESGRRWIDECQAALRRAVEGHGGRVVKSTGDGVMAVFGVPDVREDDARRALEAAVAMHAAIAEVAGPAGSDERLSLRIGLNTGEVVVAAGDDDVVGDAVNVAARLEQAAGPGEVLVGETTYRLVRLGASLRALPPLTLKGKAEPVPAFRLVSLDPPAGDDDGASPFIGRAGELERLTAVLDAAIEERRPQLVTIVGSPGVGKSRLARELATAAASRARVVEVRCDPNGSTTFAPVAAALRSAAGLADGAEDETVIAALAALFDDDEPERDRIAGIAAALLGVGEPGLPEETFWAVRRLIENAAQSRPHVFVFEDVHWAEPLLLDLIENVAEWSRGVPALFVATARPELRELRPALVEVGRRVRAVVVLEGLAVDESRRLTGALLDGTKLPDRLLDRIATASEGNPLFVRELVRMLVEDGALQRDADRWAPAVALDQIEVPPSVQAVLAARIDRLPAAEQEVLGAASVVGRSFSRGAVGALVDPGVRARLDEVIEGLRRKELVEPTGTYWLDEPVLRFHHALVQDAAYRRLLKDARAELHERAARWLQEKAGDLVEQEGAIGLQLEHAHHLAVEVGRRDAALGTEAAARLASAGRRALEADDHAAASGFLGRALRCLPEDHPGRVNLLIDQCEALLAMGDATDAAPVVHELLEVAGEDRRAYAWAACFAGELANLRDAAHLSATTERVSRAAADLADLGDAAGEAKAHAVLAGSLARLGRIADSEAALDQALGAARRAGDRRRATAILAGAPVAALWGPTPVTRASGRCLDVVRVLRITSRSPAVEATSLRCQAVLEALRGRGAAARRMLASARRSLEELGHEHGIVELNLAAGTVELLQGDLPVAEQHLAAAHEGFHALGVDVDAARAAALLGRVRLLQGRSDEALALTVEAERLGGDDLKAAIAWRAVRAEALAARGDVTEALRLATEAVDVAASTDALVDHADALMAQAEAHTVAGADAAAAASATEALRLYERKEASVLADRARRLLGDGAAPTSTPAGPVPDARRAGKRPHDNRAVAVFHQINDLALARRWDDLSERLAADIEFDDRRRVVGGARTSHRQVYLAAWQAAVDLGTTELAADTIAVRGEDLALLRVTDRGDTGADLPGEVHALQLLELRPDGTVGSVLAFDLDQLEEALAELDQRWGRRRGERTAPAADQKPDRSPQENLALRELRRMCGLIGLPDGGLEEMRRSVRPDVVSSDHRPLFAATWSGADAYVESCRGVVEVGVRSIALDPLALRGEHLCLARLTFLGQSGDVLDGAVDVLQLIEVDGDGLLVRNDVYDVDQMDEAMATMELRAERAPASNAATRFVERWIATLLDHDWEGLRALFADDIEGCDHRPLMDHAPMRGQEAVVESNRAIVEVGVTALDFEPVAIGGDRIALFRARYEGSAGAVEVLQVVAISAAGRLWRSEVFDLDQEASARARLDGLASETMGETSAAGPANRATEAWTTWSRLALERRWDDLRRRVHPDAWAVDHRRLFRGEELRGAEVFVAGTEAVVDTGVREVVHDVLAVRGDRLALIRGEMRGGEPPGALGAVEFLSVVEIDHDGRIAALEWFDVDDLEAATQVLERRQECLREPVISTPGTSVATATEAYARRAEAYGAGRFDLLERLLAPDLLLADHRPIVGGLVTQGAERYLEVMRGVRDMGVLQIVTEKVIAERGPRLCLGRQRYLGTDGAGAEGDLAENVVLQVTEIDAAGLLVRSDVYDVDQLDEATAELDRRYGATLSGADASAWEVCCAVIDAMNARSIEALDRHISADVQWVDHRPASFGAADRGEWLKVMADLFETAPTARWLIREVLEVRTGVVAVSAELRSSEHGDEWVVPSLLVARVAQDRMQSIDVFAIEDRAGFEARFGELGDAVDA